MLNNQFKLLITTIFLLASTVCHATVSEESIKKLLKLSGLTTQVEQFPSMIIAGMEQAKQQGTPIPEAAYTSMVNSVNQSILPSEIILGIKNSLMTAVNEKEAEKLLTWYESALGIEITQAEKKAGTPGGYQEMMQMADSLMADTERVKFATRLDELIGATDLAMGIQEHTGIAVYSAIMTVMRPDMPLNIEPIKAQMNAASDQTRAAIKQMVTISFIYSYKNIEDKKLNKYEGFLNDSTTKKFNQAIFDSLTRELETSVVKWADALAKSIKNNKQ